MKFRCYNYITIHLYFSIHYKKSKLIINFDLRRPYTMRPNVGLVSFLFRSAMLTNRLYPTLTVHPLPFPMSGTDAVWRCYFHKRICGDTSVDGRILLVACVIVFLKKRYLSLGELLQALFSWKCAHDLLTLTTVALRCSEHFTADYSENWIKCNDFYNRTPVENAVCNLAAI